jgi:hypothetical protein
VRPHQLARRKLTVLYSKDHLTKVISCSLYWKGLGAFFHAHIDDAALFTELKDHEERVLLFSTRSVQLENARNAVFTVDKYLIRII